jgi:myo-inositol-1-phosphate synthase
MLERERLMSKKISKTNAVTSQIDYELAGADVHVGRPTTFRGCSTASGVTSASRARPSAKCR